MNCTTNIKRWQIAGFLFTCIFGTLLHFVYEWSGESVVAAPFSGVNESTWEHMKILFVPMFIFSMIEKHLSCCDFQSFWCSKLKGITLGIFTIPVLFYTANGIFGQTPAWINIAIFYISAAMAFCYEYYLFKKEKKCFFSNTMAFSILCLIYLLFLVFTFKAPRLPIFRDPLTGDFGI